MSRQVTFEAMDRKIKVLEEELNLLFNMSIDMICIIDIQSSSRFLKVNPAFTESLGHETEAFVGKAVFDFIHPDDLGKHPARHRRSPSQGREGHRFEKQILLPGW